MSKPELFVSAEFNRGYKKPLEMVHDKPLKLTISTHFITPVFGDPTYEVPQILQDIGYRYAQNPANGKKPIARNFGGNGSSLVFEIFVPDEASLKEILGVLEQHFTLRNETRIAAGGSIRSEHEREEIEKNAQGVFQNAKELASITPDPSLRTREFVRGLREDLRTKRAGRS